LIKQLNIPRVEGPARWLGLICAAIMLLSAIFLGAVLFVVLLGAVAVIGSIIAVRLWWQRRRLGTASPGPSDTVEQGQIIDAEYSVVDDDKR
jgi:hypothetical protein